jgi:hypothetical protein
MQLGHLPWFPQSRQYTIAPLPSQIVHGVARAGARAAVCRNSSKVGKFVEIT